MRDALPQLEAEARIGVNTGEIVTGGHGYLPCHATQRD
jgi:class 3 adenylate cyclase